MWREFVKGKIWTNEVHFIQKHWTLCGKRENFYLIYLSREDFDKGNNIANLPNLREAKKYCDNLTTEI